MGGEGSFPGSTAGKESACNAEEPNLIPGSEGSPGEGICYPLQYSWTSLVPQMVKNLPANAEDAGLISGSGRPPRGENGNSLQYSCLEKESHGQRSLADYSPWGRKASDMTERLSAAQQGEVESLQHAPLGEGPRPRV